MIFKREVKSLISVKVMQKSLNTLFINLYLSHTTLPKPWRLAIITVFISFMEKLYNVQLFFLKMLIRRTFYIPRPGDFKTVFFLLFLRLIFWLQSFGSTVVKFKNIFFNIAFWRFKRRAFRHWTQVSNHFSKILIIKLQNCSKITSLFKIWFDIWVQCSNTRLLIRHTTIFEKKIF